VRRALPDGFELDDDASRIDVDAVHAFISVQSYWGRGRPRELVELAIRGSDRVLGLYRAGEQVGFARAISDGAILAYLADVYVLPAHRGRGLGLALVREMIEGAPGWDVRWLLHTGDAQALYRKLGFSDGPPPYAVMERARPPAPAERSPAGGGHPDRLDARASAPGATAPE
jgi:GNAT superfamily N-acetyltransferase